MISSNNDFLSVDLFIKTCYRDYDKFKKLMYSIDSFLDKSGYNCIIVILDKDKNAASFLSFFESPELSPEMKKKIQFHLYQQRHQQRPSSSHNDILRGIPFGNGIGYLQQQILKLTWWKFSNADIAFILDSDYYFHQHFHVSSYLQSFSYKVPWFYRTWNKTVEIWKPTTQTFFPGHPVFESMMTQMFFFKRTESKLFYDYILCNFQPPNTQDAQEDAQISFETILHQTETYPNFSEFNVFGNFCRIYCSTSYLFLPLEDSLQTYHDYLNCLPYVQA